MLDEQQPLTILSLTFPWNTISFPDENKKTQTTSPPKTPNHKLNVCNFSSSGEELIIHHQRFCQSISTCASATFLTLPQLDNEKKNWCISPLRFIVPVRQRHRKWRNKKLPQPEPHFAISSTLLILLFLVRMAFPFQLFLPNAPSYGACVITVIQTDFL